jgi:hypothetical protein
MRVVSFAFSRLDHALRHGMNSKRRGRRVNWITSTMAERHSSSLPGTSARGWDCVEKLCLRLRLRPDGDRRFCR